MEWAYSEIVTIISQLDMLGPSIIFFKKYKQTKIDLNGLYCLVFSLLFINGLLEVLYSLVTHGYVELTDFIFYLFIMKTAVICLHLLILVYIAFRWILDDATLRPLYLFFGIGIVSIIYFLYAFYVFIYETPSDTLNSYIFTDYRYKFENGY